MKFSARSQYALEAMLALTSAQGGSPIQVRNISREHGIPVRFLEQIMAALKKAGLVKSIRGARGGYLLGHEPATIQVAQILHAVEGPIREEVTVGAQPAATQVVQALWGDAQDAVRTLFEGISLDELAKRKEHLEGARSLMYHI
ncbi:MAG: Rrf2 family transcriptional regulator [Nitrospirae bacterium]|nr:Rrf2 family transcriptional regulator [Nitrospirota bacterium]